MGSTAVHREAVEDPPKPVSAARQCVRYALHLAVVYVIVNSTTMWLAGRTYYTVLPPDSAASANGEFVPVCIFTPVFLQPFPGAARRIRLCPVVSSIALRFSFGLFLW